MKRILQFPPTLRWRAYTDRQIARALQLLDQRLLCAYLFLQPSHLLTQGLDQRKALLI